MKESSITNFGLLIAYLLPGFVALWGVSFFSETVRSWLGSPEVDAPTMGGFLYVTLASIAAGLTVSTIRWMIVDTVHHLTGVHRPQWDFSRLQSNVAAFDVLVEIHYHYYQFYANMLIAILFTSVARHVAPQTASGLGWIDMGVAAIIVVFFAGSRDTLEKYYTRTAELLARRQGQLSRSTPKGNRKQAARPLSKQPEPLP